LITQLKKRGLTPLCLYDTGIRQSSNTIPTIPTIIPETSIFQTMVMHIPSANKIPPMMNVVYRGDVCEVRKLC
jgi:hypothetical protein